MLRATLEAGSPARQSGQEVAMADIERPDETGSSGSGISPGSNASTDDLGRRSRALEEALASRRPAKVDEDRKPVTGGMAGFGQAMKLSSEFIAGVAVGAGIGWLIDSLAGTSPWGLIVFLMLGFAAGVLNVLRSVGKVAEPDSRAMRDKSRGPEGN
jgi:ATP synthase protein I